MTYPPELYCGSEQEKKLKKDLYWLLVKILCVFGLLFELGLH